MLGSSTSLQSAVNLHGNTEKNTNNNTNLRQEIRGARGKEGKIQRIAALPILSRVRAHNFERHSSSQRRYRWQTVVDSH